MPCLSSQPDPAGRRPASRLAASLLGLAGLAYPFIVLAGLRFLPPWALCAVPLLLLLTRLTLGRRGPTEAVLGVAALVVLVLIEVDPVLAVRAWPVLVSLGMAALFAASFRWGPVMVERIAEAAEGPMPPAARPYLRRVTAVWTVFFVLNAAVAGWTVLCGTLEHWALYNGFVSYLLIGTLFAGEMVVRRLVRPKQAA
jgi:uncharacterized membrane protein